MVRGIQRERSVDPVKIKQPAVAVEVDRRQLRVALENVIRFRLITDSTQRWATR